ncbi:uncharacterized protein BDW47DRAFT_109497 [Aspergillus candidus]|uniref:Uncharacterized protein n=1 Tax=Aspergillus candidus TaxID=41067 RepID=A0A2I2F5V4_ASPCN|nr:hypothetical protein BDW47DRAFT_109497 [Aspergillus candidus]PLB35946.1 hypothetical protein BDW47DRAFT_109497 [Aspergillus candidus]
MHAMPSKFVEILEPEDISHLRRSASDVRLEDVLADHEAIVGRPRSSTNDSAKSKTSLDGGSARWKRLSNMLVATKR